MILIAYFISGFALAVGLLRLKKPFFTLAKRSVSLLDVLVSDLDEDTKFERVSANVGGTLSSLGWVTLGAAFISAVAYAIIYGGAILIDSLSPNASTTSPYGLIALAVGSVLPFLKKSQPKSGYSDLAQLFHHLVLDNHHLGKRLFRGQIKGIENPVPSSEAETHAPSAVIITGLARAGTTALTRELAARGPFSSLDYSNMPLLLAPKLWRKFYNPKRTEDQERAHGDGIKVGLASVEALEEYFFTVFAPGYIEPNRVNHHEITAEVNDLYRKYQRSITAPGNLYLAKNNNCITRFESLRKLNPDFKIYVLFRDPLQHAYSLMKQHLKFVKTQEDDPFVLTYMEWLGHFEFGKGQRPFALPAGELAPFEGDAGSINYWLQRWISYYSYVIGINDVNLISYERFLSNPTQVLNTISKEVGIEIRSKGTEIFEKESAEVPPCDEHLRTRAYALHQRLTESAKII